MHTTNIARTVVALYAASVWGQTAPAQTNYRFITIGPTTESFAAAYGINNSGMVSGNYADSNNISHGFVGSGARFLKVDYPGGTSTALYGLNNLGVAIGTYTDSAGNNHTATYTISTRTWAQLPDIPNYSGSAGFCINDAGYAIGTAYGNPSVAWFFDPGSATYSFISVPGVNPGNTDALCINNKDEIVGNYFAKVKSHSFLFAYGAYENIDVDGSANTYAFAMNDRGAITGNIFSVSTGTQGYVESVSGSVEIVNYPGATATSILGINEAGDLCGAYGTAGNFVNVPFIAIKLP